MSYISHECSAEVALYYLGIFEDDVDSAVTAFLESGPAGEQEEHVPHLEDETGGTSQEQPQLSPQLTEMQCWRPQAQQTLPQRYDQELQQENLHQPRGDEIFFNQTVHNYFKLDHPAAGTAGWYV